MIARLARQPANWCHGLRGFVVPGPGTLDGGPFPGFVVDVVDDGPGLVGEVVGGIDTAAVDVALPPDVDGEPPVPESPAPVVDDCVTGNGVDN